MALKKNTILIILFIGILFAFSSCKSHKKIQSEDKPYIGETISKKKKKNTRERLTGEAVTWLGTPYGYGRSDKGVATDCSGMVLTVYEQIAGIKLPRNSAQQADFCKSIKEKEILPGDLVFFATGKDKKTVSHVGIMLDKNKFVHASGSKGVIISEMTTPYYNRTFIKFGRVPGMSDR